MKSWGNKYKKTCTRIENLHLFELKSVKNFCLSCTSLSTERCNVTWGPHHSVNARLRASRCYWFFDKLTLGERPSRSLVVALSVTNVVYDLLLIMTPCFILSFYFALFFHALKNNVTLCFILSLFFSRLESTMLHRFTLSFLFYA